MILRLWMWWLVVAHPCFSSVYSTSGPSPQRPLCQISSAFGEIWYGSELGTDQVLRACHVFAGVLKTTGPRAVRDDFCSNLGKAEKLVQRAKRSSYATTTLKQLLKYERDILNIHDHDRLKDPSGAIGFLWMRRSLEFQESLYGSLVQGKSPREATLTAYKAKLQPYHGPVLCRLYSSFFRYKTPTRDEIFQQLLGGHRVAPEKVDSSSRVTSGGTIQKLIHRGRTQEEIVIGDMAQLLKTWKPILAKWKQNFEELNMEDRRKV